MISRWLIWISVALGLAVFTLDSASAQDDRSVPLPAGTTACDFSALARQAEPGGPSLRESPRQDARIVGRLPVIKDKSTDSAGYGPDGELPEFRVIGSKDGWFLVEAAAYPEPFRPKLHTGRSWLDGTMITTHLFRETLKKASSNTSPDVTYLYGTSDGIAYRPYDLDVQRVLECSGPWLHVEIHRPGAKTLSGQPASTDETVRGWTDKSCPEQRNEPCSGRQFDYPWSPLAAGVTECNFSALSRDPDLAGLNVRAAPDANAPILGRLSPPVDTVDGFKVGFKVLADVQVIGFRKGWFLIKVGPYNDADLPAKTPKPYSGRGWVSGNMLTAGLLRHMLKQAPSENAADVVDLNVDGVSDPQSVKMTRILSCSGDWVHVEVALEKGMKPLLQTDAPKGAVRGWTNGTCTAQLTTCDFDRSTPWPPAAPPPPE